MNRAEVFAQVFDLQFSFGSAVEIETERDARAIAHGAIARLRVLSACRDNAQLTVSRPFEKLLWNIRPARKIRRSCHVNAAA